MRTWWDSTLRDSEEIRLYRMARRFGGDNVRTVNKTHSRVAKKWIRRYWKYRYRKMSPYDRNVVINGIPGDHTEFQNKFGGLFCYSNRSQVGPYVDPPSGIFEEMTATFTLVGKIGKHYIFSETLSCKKKS